MLTVLLLTALLLSVLGVAQISAGLLIAQQAERDGEVPGPLLASVVITLLAYAGVVALMFLDLVYAALTR